MYFIFKANKPKDKKQKVLFVDGSDQFQKGRNQNFFNEEHSDYLLSVYDKWENIENRSKIVSIEEIQKNEFNLNITRYVSKKQESEDIDIKATYKELEKAYTEFIESEEKVKKLLKEVKIK